MPDQSIEVRPSKIPGKVLSLKGELMAIPEDWSLLPPGDAALSRRLKLAGPCWLVKDKQGRRLISRGIWADRSVIERLQQERESEKATGSYQTRLQASRQRRAASEIAYQSDFQDAVYQALGFAANHRLLADRLSQAIATHATPVGSGTVARTQRIPIEERAQAAIIAWMRHQTTDYDQMRIPLVKGKRREVRRKLAAASKQLLDRYRRGESFPASECPLSQALDRATEKS